MELGAGAPLLPASFPSLATIRRTNKRLDSVIKGLKRWAGVARVSEQEPQRLGEVTFEQETRRLHGPAGTSHLSPNELLLLLRLIQDRGRVLTHAVLRQDVGGPGSADAHPLLHDRVSRLRPRFAAAGATVDPIETVHGVGYRLRPQRAGDAWGDIPFAL